MNFNTILEQYQHEALFECDKGTRFERLMQLYLQTEPYYASCFSKVRMWEEFLFHKDLGGQDIDTVPSYYLNLLLSIITVNVKTVEIIKGLPKVKF